MFGNAIIPVIVRCSRHDKRKYKWRLRRYGLRWCGDGVFAGEVRESGYRGLSAYCRQEHLRICINNGYGTRSTNYRSQFLRYNPPAWRDMYFCAYCGRLMKRKDMTVDHIYPVHAVERDIALQKKLKRKGYSSVNDVRNLVAACPRCNKKKGASLGSWVLKGEIGRHNGFWSLIWVIRITVVCTAAAFILLHFVS